MGCDDFIKLNDKLLIDFKRSMNKCLSLVQNINDDNRWRLEMFVEDLEDRLNVLVRILQDQDELAEYIKKVKFLKGVISVDRLKSPVHKLMATQILSPVSVSRSTVATDKTKEIQMHSEAKFSQEMRQELLGQNESQSSLRKRRNVDGNDDYDMLYSYHLDIQEKTAQEMLEFTQNLKQNIVMAHSMIKKDNEVFEITSRMADNNTDHLRINSDRLATFVRRSCQCWLWIMLAVVSASFLLMIVFIRLFKKRNDISKSTSIELNV